MSNHHNEGMAGFDPEFRDLDQYIRVIAKRIWDELRENWVFIDQLDLLLQMDFDVMAKIG